MKFDKIVGFGDSWMWGDELVDPNLPPDTDSCCIHNASYRESNCFLGLLGDHYGVPVINFGWPGSSLQSMIWTYLWWIENKPQEAAGSLVIAGLTNSSRNSFYNPRHQSRDNTDPPWNRFVHDQWVRSSSHLFDNDWQQLVKLNTVLTQDHAIDKLRYQQTVLFFSGASLLHNHRLVQFDIVAPPCIVDAPGYQQSFLGVHEWLLSCAAAYLTKNNHPNIQGHKMISQRLIDWIDDAMLA